MGLRAALRYRLEEFRSRRLRPVTVAVVDSGVDATHPELAKRVVKAVHVEQDDGECRIIAGDPSKNADKYGHGTAVASIIAGLAPNSKIIDICVLDANNVGTGEALVAGFGHAVDSQADIINMSLAARARCSASLVPLCEQAYRNNQLVIAARRNMPLLGEEGFPAEFASCIGVDLGFFPDPFHMNFLTGSGIEFRARGEDVRVAAMGGGYTTMTGTSFATPTVSGICALLRGAYPDLQTFEVKAILASGCQ